MARNERPSSCKKQATKRKQSACKSDPFSHPPATGLQARHFPFCRLRLHLVAVCRCPSLQIIKLDLTTPHHEASSTEVFLHARR